jgi:competence protein ComEC
VEHELLASARQRLAAEVLVAPHHGSRTSSSVAFVRAVHPAYVLFAVGYRNRFGFPRNEVVARYRAAGARVLDTAQSGAIQIRINTGRALSVSRHRVAARSYWH